MRQILSVSVIAMVLSAAPGAQSGTASVAGNADPVKQELIALDKKFDEARRAGDTAFIADFLTEDFLRVTPNGIVGTRADVLKGVSTAKPAPPPPPDAVLPTYTVYLYGDTAVMAHSNSSKSLDDIAPNTAVTHVFVKQQGRWKMAAWANTIAQPTNEQAINLAGYQLLDGGKTQDAIELFKINVRLYPESWNAYDSLGEGYAKAGETALAIENYEKSVKINPNNEPGKAALAKLKGK